MHHARLVDHFALGSELAWIDDDFRPTVVPVDPQLEYQDRGLGGDLHLHQGGDFQPVSSGKMLAGKKLLQDHAQALGVRLLQAAHEEPARARAAPEFGRDRAALAPSAPSKPAEHQRGSAPERLTDPEPATNGVTGGLPSCMCSPPPLGKLGSFTMRNAPPYADSDAIPSAARIESATSRERSRVASHTVTWPILRPRRG